MLPTLGWNTPAGDKEHLSRFHAGDRTLMAAIYREHYEVVDRAVGRVLTAAADRESVVQEVFCRLLASEQMRRGFQGGSLAGWLTTVARNQAIDFARRYHRELRLVQGYGQPGQDAGSDPGPDPGEREEATLLVERFVRQILPAKWAPVFRARFLDGLSQREAAAALGLRRTTLAYREFRIGRMLKQFLLGTMALLLLFLQPGDPDFRARSGSVGPGPQSIELVRVPRHGQPQLVRDEIQASDELGVRYRNPHGKRYLLLFARDAHDHFYWYFPAWTDPALAPLAVPIERDEELHELGEVVGHDFDTDAIVVTAIFTDTPLSVRAVEDAGRAQPRERLALTGAEVITMPLRVRR